MGSARLTFARPIGRLACFYLLHDDEAAARRIHQDMSDERPERLTSLKNELLRITSKDFWEVIDRGANFDYMDAKRREKLTTFFSWFQWTESNIRPSPPPTASLESGRHQALDPAASS